MDTFDNRNSRVLVFDDNDVDRFAVCLALNQSGFAGAVHDTGSVPQALEHIQTTTFDCIYIGDSTARTHLFSVLLALDRVGYRGRIVIVAYGLELTAAHEAGVTIDLRGLRASRRSGLRRIAGNSRDYVSSEEDRVPTASFPSSGEPPLSRVRCGFFPLGSLAFPLPFLGSRGPGKPFGKESASVLQLAKQSGIHYAASAIS